MDRERIRLLALLLSISMALGTVSSAAYAQELETEPSAQTWEAETETPSSMEQLAEDNQQSAGDAASDQEGTRTEETSEETLSSEPTETQTEGTEAADSGEAVQTGDETETTDEALPSDPEQTEAPSETEETGQETEAPTGETQEAAEESTEETLRAYPWDEMDDEAFADFLRQGEYMSYEGDEEAAVSLLERVDRVEDPVLREELEGILIAWLFPEESIEETPAAYAAGDAGPVTLEELNGPEMFFKQEQRGTCTLAANAMLVRRAARLNGYADWRNIDENALRGTAWIEGTGMCWHFNYAGISVDRGLFANSSMETFLAFLKRHPEGFVAYNANAPHAVLITDYDESTGTIYCADPGFAYWRMPLSESILYRGSQEATVASFTSYWAVSSPSLQLKPSLPPLAQREITLSAQYDGRGVKLDWNDTLAAEYRIYRSESPEGPWETPISAVPGGTASWTDEGAQVEVTYYYRVRSMDSDGKEGFLSESVSCTPVRQEEKLGEGMCTETIRWIAYEDGLLLVMGNGEMPNYSNEVEEPWLSIRSQITEIRVSDGITSVGSSNFGGMEHLTRVSLPATVTSLGNWVFRGCSALREISMPGARSIGYAAFRHCTALTELELPDSVSVIGDWAFSKCDSLTRIKLPASLNAVGDAVFYEDAALETVELPSGVHSIGAHAFRGCKALRNITLPSTVNRISSYAFALCSSLGDLDLSGSSGLSLGEGAFFNCTGITRLSLPACQLGARAFAYCYGLRYVVLDQGRTVSSLERETFHYCVSLNRFLVLGGGINAAGSAFQNTAAQVLVSSSYYGELDTLLGNCRWRSYQKAGSCSTAVQWYLDNNGNLIIYGSGAIPSYSANAAPWSGTGAQKVTVERGISAVGDYAFSNLPQLRSITFRGSAPAFGAASLAGVQAEVLYHNTDGSWTGKTGGNLGGSPAWRENHSYAWRLLKAPGFVSGGELSGSCSICGSSATVQVPKLDRESYDYSETATTARYTWKITEFGPICFELRFVTITAQPTNQTAPAGGEATFTLRASGNGLSYRWQRQNPQSGAWTDCGSRSTLTLQGLTQADSGAQFRCIVTDGNGKTVTSETATLTIN